MHTILTCYKGVVSIYGSMVFAKMGVPVPNRLPPTKLSIGVPEAKPILE